LRTVGLIKGFYIVGPCGLIKGHVHLSAFINKGRLTTVKNTVL